MPKLDIDEIEKAIKILAKQRTLARRESKRLESKRLEAESAGSGMFTKKGCDAWNEEAGFHNYVVNPIEDSIEELREMCKTLRKYQR